MKIFKRTVSLFLAFCLCAGMLLPAAAVNGIRSRQEQTDHHCTSHVQ